ncbi:MAG: HNH endonuclease [Planctomycetota bacterium]
MAYWWVNQKQTFEHEFRGGYLWSPKRNRNGARNPFYEFMRAVFPGDVVFSYARGRIAAYGLITSEAYEQTRPREFGQDGERWNAIGWMVDVSYRSVGGDIRPSEHMDVIGSLLPEKYSPLQQSGRGNQNMYLTQLSPQLGQVIEGLINQELTGRELFPEPAHYGTGVHSRQLEWEDEVEQSIVSNAQIPETTRKALVQARRGQGAFRNRVLEIEHSCRVTGVEDPALLIASHCKPWRSSTDEERLDGNNGLVLTPNADRLFDRGWISFADEGGLLVSPRVAGGTLARLGIGAEIAARPFTDQQCAYLTYHRNDVFLSPVL